MNLLQRILSCLKRGKLTVCGIAGVLSRYHPVDEKVLRSLRDGLRHRGPDSDGIWLSQEGRAGLVHTRLAILDLSSAGCQPMRSQDGRFVIVFNGEIFNFRELRRDLEGCGEVFQTRSDTEILLRLYQREGAAMMRERRFRSLSLPAGRAVRIDGCPPWGSPPFSRSLVHAPLFDGPLFDGPFTCSSGGGLFHRRLLADCLSAIPHTSRCPSSVSTN